MGTVTPVIADSVRLALPTQAPEIAALQRRSWLDVLPPAAAAQLLKSVTLAEMTESWQAAIQRPPLAQMRVLVALGSQHLVGFAALGPSNDADAEAGADALIAEFSIDPAAYHRGHGSRLINACIDTLRADGFSRATWWVGAEDNRLRNFLIQAGWAADGAHSEVAMDAGGPRVKLVRLHTGVN